MLHNNEIGEGGRVPHAAPYIRDDPSFLQRVEEHNAKKYAEAALHNECQAVATAAEGTRNDTLNRAGFNLARFITSGQLTEQHIRDALTDAAQSSPPRPPRDHRHPQLSTLR